MKGKIIVGLLAICVLAGSGWLLYSHHGQHIAAAVQQQAASISHPDMAFVGEDFTLPAVDNDLPVYDRYTVQQRKDKGLPLTYGRPEIIIMGIMWPI